MKVRIVNQPTGLLNGRDWPAVGEVLEVADEHGADMCAAGIGVPVKDDEVETAVPSADEVETADKPATPRGRKPKES